MDGNTADHRPRVPPLRRGACVCGAFICFLITASLVVAPYGLNGVLWALGTVILLGFFFFVVVVGCLAIGGIYEFGCFLLRLGIAAVDAGGWLAEVDDGGGMDADDIAALTAPFMFTMDVGAVEGWTECSICLCVADEGESVRRLPCGHLFHAGCIDVWLRNHTTCPICRDVLLPV